MKAWSVALTANTDHGIVLGSWFLLAPTRGDAVAGAVRTLLDGHEGCRCSISASHEVEIALEIVQKAVAELGGDI